MSLSTQPYKGSRDFYPEDQRIQRFMFDRMSEVCEKFGYLEYDGPMIEPFELYAAKTGEEIVTNQLYHFVDRGERKVAIRPEMTPTLARMVAGKLQELPKPVRWYAIPHFWRYERPQRGRLREFWQLNVDVLGGDPLLADAEVIQVAFDIIDSFGGGSFAEVKVNHRKLIEFFFVQKLKMDSEKVAKVIRAVDAREKIGEEKYQTWLNELGVTADQQQDLERFFKSNFDEIAKWVPCEGVQDLEKLFHLLEESGLKGRAKFDPMLMRGLDYYTGTVFEVFDVSPENRRAMFGGGRYDNLMGLFGKPAFSGVGFGMGDVTLRNFLETHKLLPAFDHWVDVLVTLPKIELRSVSEKIAKDLRSQGLKVMTPLSVEGFGAQLKLATKHGARYVVLLGEDELAKGEVVLKNLSNGEQKTVAQDRVFESIS